jgi:hypothetical protein
MGRAFVGISCPTGASGRPRSGLGFCGSRFLCNLGVLRDFRRILKNFPRIFENFLRMFENFSRTFENFPRMFENFPRTFENFSRMFENFARTVETFPLMFETSPRIYENLRRVCENFRRGLENFDGDWKQAIIRQIYTEDFYDGEESILVAGAARTAAGKIGGQAAALGLTPAQVTEFEGKAQNILDVMDFRSTTAQTDKAVTEWRDQALNGDPKGDPTSPAPAYEVWGGGAVTRGLVQQFFDIRDLIDALPGSTEAIMTELALLGAEITPPDPAGVVPTLLTTAAQVDAVWTALVGNRQGATQFEVLTAPVGSNTWTSRGTYTGHSIQLTETITDDKPIQLQARVRLLKNNEYYGQPSEISIVTINP